jgi:hypothetical protein
MKIIGSDGGKDLSQVRTRSFINRSDIRFWVDPIKELMEHSDRAIGSNKRLVINGFGEEYKEYEINYGNTEIMNKAFEILGLIAPQKPKKKTIKKAVKS